jgi:probable HAF family extracellular repeat protein
VVGAFGPLESRTIYRWTRQGGIEPIGSSTPGGPWVSGVSANGGVVVARLWVGAQRWTAGDGWQNYYNGGPADVRGVSADGSVAVGVVAPNHQVTAARFTGLNTYQVIGPVGSWATGVSADGSVVCGHHTDAQDRDSMFRWDAVSGFVDLGSMPWASSPWSDATAISGDGSTIIGLGNGDNTQEGFYWRAGTGFARLGIVPPGQTLVPTAVNYDGSVIVGRNDGPTDTAAFYWSQATGLVDLQQLLLSNGAAVQGWRSLEATGVSADGMTVIGGGFDASGQLTGFIATIPAPATLLALSALVVLRRRRTRA